MDVVVRFVGPLLAFVAIYAVIHAWAKRRGHDPAVPWGWLAAILLCVGVAVVLGAVLEV
jgi:heme A synthase